MSSVSAVYEADAEPLPQEKGAVAEEERGVSESGHADNICVAVALEERGELY